MKRILRITAEYVEEWEPGIDDEDCEVKYEDYTFADWEECDWDNVGRPLDRMQDTGWVIKRKKLVKE